MNLALFWVSLLCLVLLLIGALGWLMALWIARDANLAERHNRDLLRRHARLEARLLRFLNRRLVEVLREASPKEPKP